MAFLMLPLFLSFVSILSLQDGQFNDKSMWNTLAPIFCDFMWIHFELISSIHFKSWIHFDFELFLVKICFVDVKWRCDCNSVSEKIKIFFFQHYYSVFLANSRKIIQIFRGAIWCQMLGGLKNFFWQRSSEGLEKRHFFSMWWILGGLEPSFQENS